MLWNSPVNSSRSRNIKSALAVSSGDLRNVARSSSNHGCRPVSLANVAATTYTANAAPINQQLSRDTYCGTLNLDQSGVKDKTGASDDCW